MGFLKGKKILIVGLASKKSIAYGIANAMYQQGASLALGYQGERFESRVKGFGENWDCDLAFPCDVSSDEQIDKLFDQLAKHWDGLDGIVHSIGFAPADQLQGNFLDSITREGFKIAHDISSYSFAALAKSGRTMMQGRNAALLTLTYLGAKRTLPNYNVMGLAKASLEANVRYMANALGPEGTRVNAISAGPIRTLAASGIKSMRKMLVYNEKCTPLRRNTTIEEVGHSAAFLCSDLASGITGQTLYVDSGFNIVGMSDAELA